MASQPDAWMPSVPKPAHTTPHHTTSVHRSRFRGATLVAPAPNRAAPSASGPAMGRSSTAGPTGEVGSELGVKLSEVANS